MKAGFLKRGAGAALALWFAGCTKKRAEQLPSAPAGPVVAAQTSGPDLPGPAAGLGQVRVFSVAGDVDLIGKDGVIRRLVRGGVFTEGSLVKVGPGGGALLVLSNGTTIRLFPFSELWFTMFRQKPFDEKAAGTYLRLGRDPSKSTTILYLRNGLAQIEVKPLNAARGSSCEVDTPAGDIEAREAVFSLKVSRLAGGQLRKVLADCLVGVVNFTPVAGILAKRGQPGHSDDFSPSFALGPAQQIQVAVRWDPIIGQVTGGSVEGASLPLDAANAELEDFDQSIAGSLPEGPVRPPLQKITGESGVPAGLPTVPFEALPATPTGHP
jgi:hypothetical protein